MYRSSGSGRNYSYSSQVPRGPASAYAFYVQDHYRRLRRHFSVTDRRNQQKVMKYCHQVWKSEPENVKQRYIELAEWDKERARNDRIEWLKLVVLGEAQYVPYRQRKPRPQGFPARPRNGFMIYAADVRADVKNDFPQLTAPKIMQEISRRWNQLDKESKQPYVEQSGREKLRYEEAKRTWRDNQRNERTEQRIAKQRNRLNRMYNQKVPNPEVVKEKD